MDSWYDAEEDILGMTLEKKPYWKSVEMGSVIIDLSHDGSVIGIEVIKASKVLSEDVHAVLQSLQAK
jgi:uncharacterized protein YuzE